VTVQSLIVFYELCAAVAVCNHAMNMAGQELYADKIIKKFHFRPRLEVLWIPGGDMGFSRNFITPQLSRSTIIYILLFLWPHMAHGGEMNTEHLDISSHCLLGKFIPSEQIEFIEVDAAYGNKAKMYLHKQAYGAFVAMAEEARNAGIVLTILSATRTFRHQKEIWETKWNEWPFEEEHEKRALTILQYTSMPGASRHHWGTDIDINSLENGYFEKGEGLKAYSWLKIRARDFGFGQPYTAKGIDRPFGHEEEKWHWSYLPLSRKMLNRYLKKISHRDLNGFEGSSTAAKIDVIGKYVRGINKECYQQEAD